MTFSIRSKLTFWYVLLLTFSLVAFSMSFFYALSTVSLDRIDKRVDTVASMMMHSIVAPPGRLIIPRKFDNFLESFFGVKTTGNYIQIFDKNGHTIGKSSNLQDVELLLTKKTYINAKNGLDTFESVKASGYLPVRVLTRPIVIRGIGLIGIVQVGSSLESMQETSHYMVYFFIVGILTSIFFAAVVGWFLARKALAPVKEITKVARGLGVENLGERLHISGPNDEFGRLASTFNNMLERLEESFMRIDQFTADASHELKTPLTVMKGEVEVALRGGASEEDMREVLVSNLEEIDRMNFIIRNLLTLARVGAEKGTIPREVVAFDKVLKDRFNLVKRTAVNRGVVAVITKCDAVLVLAEDVALGQVVSNLLDNAVKYTENGGSVIVTLEEIDDSAILKVKDTGQGIPMAELPYVFDRFFRADKARTRPTEQLISVGLGLSICKEIIESYDGKIEVESEQGAGSIFSVILPSVKLS